MADYGALGPQLLQGSFSSLEIECEYVQRFARDRLLAVRTHSSAHPGAHARREHAVKPAHAGTPQGAPQALIRPIVEAVLVPMTE